MEKLQTLKGKIGMLPQFGLTYDEQILIALPHIFNYEDNQRMKRIQNLPKYFQAVCDDLFRNLSKIRHRATYNLILGRILPTVWPLLLRQADPQKFNDHIKYLKSRLQLGSEHICFMVHYSKKFPDKYPEFCIRHTNEYFHKSKSNFELLINVMVGEQCIESLTSVLRFNVHRELMLWQQNQFVQEEFRVSSIKNILEKMLSRKNNINKLIRDVGSDATFIKHIDKWMKYQRSYVLNIFRCLKIICLCQCLFDLKCADQQSELAKSQQPMFKILWKVGERLLNRLFVGKVKQKILILDWVLQGKIWQQCNDELKTSLMYFLITCYQTHTRDFGSSKQSLTQKIEREENTLVIKYLIKIKEKHFHNVCFASKVPKSYLRVNLGMIEPVNNKEHIESNNSLLKNSTGTVSLSKFGGQSLGKNEGMGISNADKLIASVIKHTENLELHKIFIICLALKEDIKNKNFDEETDSQQKPKSQKSSSFRRLFYYIYKCIREYEEILLPNILSWETSKMLSTFAIYFGFESMKELYRADLYDLELLSNGEFCVQNISVNLLKNSVYYSLATIYVIERANNRYSRALSENKKSGVNKDEKISDITQKVSLDSSKMIFVDCLERFLKFMTKKKQEMMYLKQICLVDNWRILKSLFLNLLYYFLSKLSRRPKTIKQKNSQQLYDVLGIGFKEYFLKEEPNPEELNVIRILATSHKVIQNWRRCTRRNQGPQAKIPDSIYESHDQEVSKAQIYWNFVVNLAKSTKKLKLFSRNFERANCIKQSIYMMHEHNFELFPPKFTTQEANRVLNLYSRLESHLNICRPYISKNMESKSSNYYEKIEDRNQVHSYQDEDTKRKWYNALKFITQNSNIAIFTSTISQVADKICILEDIEEMDQILNQVYILSLYYQALYEDNYSGLYSNLPKSNEKEMCLSIVNCLDEKRQSYLSSKKKDSEKIKQISTIIYNERLRFKQYGALGKQLNRIHPENMSPEQARAAIILYSQTQQFHKVRLLFRALQENRQDYKSYKQELEFRNIEAGYKCIMFYPTDQIIRDLQSIVKYIQEENDPQNITKNSTSSMFESFKFICENYPTLSLEQENKILRLLNRYLKKVYSFSNLSLSIEAVYFILRFILIESNNSDELIQDSNNFPYEIYKANILEPHRPMLIGIFSQNEKKNQLICKILTRIAEHDPKASSWWLYGLKNHCKTNDKLDKLDSVIENCGKSIYDEVKRKMINLDVQFAWIDWLFSADEKAQAKPIPKQMVGPFSTDVILEKVVKISPLGQGKSKPVIIEFKATKKKNPTTVYLIRKTIPRNSIGFRAESSTANFFKDSKLLKQGVTYSIIHLSKYCLLVEHIKHFSTLDSLMLSGIPANETCKLQEIVEMTRASKVLGPAYDNERLKINFQLRHFFANQSTLVNSWWNKYTNFVKTYAQWCFLGYIVGLGDRHNNNILVTEEGQTIHIDFQFIFDTGMSLPCPEWVPFRLSRGLLHQLSIIEPYGLIYSEFIKTAEKYRSKSRQVWLAESHFSFFKKGNISIHKRAELNHRLYEQSKKVFENATCDVLLRDMFKGWGSYK